MKHAFSILATALLFNTLVVHAADVAPAAGGPAVSKAASSPTVKAAQQPGGAPPNAGGSGGGVSSNGSNTGTQVAPKKPKCPDPTKCPAEVKVGK